MLGDDVSIGSLSVVEHHVSIGDRVRVHSQCFIPEYSVLEDDAWLGPRVTLTNAPAHAARPCRPASPGSTWAGARGSAPT
ncbi:hypothetical protein ACFQX7_08040 [Luedemannella flava]